MPRKLTQVALLLCTALLCANVCAQVPVVLAPVPQFQAFDQNGDPLAFGCVFTYRSQTSSPLLTYTDFTGTVSNQNPVPLSASGTANIWLQAGQAYTLVVKSNGGTKCSLGTTMATVDGVGGGSSQQTSTFSGSGSMTFVISSQVQLFSITLTGDVVGNPLSAVGVIPPGIAIFQITQDGVGGHSFTWPVNSIGGCPIGTAANQVTTQIFEWNGANAIALGPCVTGLGPAISAGSLALTGAGVFGGTVTAPAFISSSANPSATGAVRLANTDLFNWRNVANSADYGIGVDGSDRGLWSFTNGLVMTGAIPNLYFGGVTASFPAFLRNSVQLNLRLADNSADANLQLGELFANTAVTIGAVRAHGTAAAGSELIATSPTDAQWSVPTVVKSSVITQLGGNISVPANTTTNVLSQSVTMPSAGCPCRAFVSYGQFMSTSNALYGSAVVNDGTNPWATAVFNTTGSTTLFGVSGSSFTGSTYANSASVTFTVKIRSTDAMTVLQSNTVAGQSGWLNVTVFTSN